MLYSVKMDELVWNTCIIKRREDGCVNATSMCFAGKRFRLFSKLVTSREILKKYPVEVIRGNGACSWVHPEVALEFAKYLSADLHTSVHCWLYPDEDSEKSADESEEVHNSDTDEEPADEANEKEGSQEDQTKPHKEDGKLPGSQIKIWKEVSIQRRVTDGYINATAMGKAYGKQFYDYSKTDRATAYMQALSKQLWSVDPQTEDPFYLLPTNIGSENLNPQLKKDLLVDTHSRSREGTFIHPRLAIDFARWLSPEFAVWMDQWFLDSIVPKTPALTDKITTELPPQTIFVDAPADGFVPHKERHVYMLYSQSKNITRFGRTDDLERRLAEHKRDIAPDAYYVIVALCHGHLECDLHALFKHLRTDKRDEKMPGEIDGDKIKELIPEMHKRCMEFRDKNAQPPAKKNRIDFDEDLYSAQMTAKIEITKAECVTRLAQETATANEATARATEASRIAAANAERLQLENDVLRLKIQAVRDGKLSLDALCVRS
jgi:hypothetical protein